MQRSKHRKTVVLSANVFVFFVLVTVDLFFHDGHMMMIRRLDESTTTKRANNSSHTLSLRHWCGSSRLLGITTIRVHPLHAISYFLCCWLSLFCYSWYTCILFNVTVFVVSQHRKHLWHPGWASPFGRVLMIYSSDIVRVKNRRWRVVRCRNAQCSTWNYKITKTVKYLSFDNQSFSKYSVNRVFSGLADHWHYSQYISVPPLLFQSWNRLHDYWVRIELHYDMSSMVLLR